MYLKTESQKHHFRTRKGKIKEHGGFDNKSMVFNTFKYHVFAPMGRFQLELIYLYFPPPSHLLYVIICMYIIDGTTVENKGKLILIRGLYRFSRFPK